MNNHKQGNRSLPGPLPGKTGWPWTSTHEPLPETLPDGSPWPKISVVTPSFNQGQFIEETIRLVLLQGYPNLEFIIIDGGSTDNTLEIIQKYEPWLAYWVSEPDRGQSHAVNKGIQRATGEILLWLNSDDLVLPGAFATAARKFAENPGVKMVIGQAHIINPQGEITGELRSKFTTWEEVATSPRNSIRQVSTFFARHLFEELGYLDESLHIAMDTELLIRFTRSHTPLISEDYLTAFRVQPEAKTASQLFKGYLETDRVRPLILGGMKQVGKYKKNSATNWLSIAENNNLNRESRINCLFRSINQHPLIFTKRRFWAALWKLIS